MSTVITPSGTCVMRVKNRTKVSFHAIYIYIICYYISYRDCDLLKEVRYVVALYKIYI